MSIYAYTIGLYGILMMFREPDLLLSCENPDFILFFFYGPFLNSLLNLLQYCFCFMFWVLAPRHVGS